MSDLSIHDRDTLAFEVPVRHTRTKAAFDLTGATIIALAGQGGVGSLTGTVVVPAPATAGRIQVSFAAAALGVGAWTVEVIVTSGAETQTVATLTVNVTRSLSTP